MTDRSTGEQSRAGIYLRGVAMGTADAIPGVSGGTIALITGVYERLIAAITAIDRRVVADLLGGLRDDPERASDALHRVDAAFLALLLAGILTAVVSVSRLVHVAVVRWPLPTFAFLFGLIAASAAVLVDAIALDGRRFAAGAAGVAVAALASGGRAGATATGPIATAAAGAIAVSAMLLPGISGSLLLLVVGQYERMIAVLSAFVDAILAVPTGGALGAVVDPGTTVVTFLAGALVGLATVAHAVRWALDRAPRDTMAFLVGLIVGALRAPLAEMAAAVDVWTPDAVLLVIGPAVAGAAVIVALDRAAGVTPTPEAGME